MNPIWKYVGIGSFMVICMLLFINPLYFVSVVFSLGIWLLIGFLNQGEASYIPFNPYG